MSTIPQSNDEAVTWVIDHVALWTTNPESIGLDSAAVTELAGLAQTAQQRQQARNNARDAARGATGAFNSQAKAMRDFAAQQVRRVRTFAQGSEEPALIYQAAGIPAPADPAPAPAPGTPQAFKVRLLQSGSIEITFECPNPPRVAAVLYRVERRLGTSGGQAPFQFLKNAMERRFTDDTIPLGTAQVAYRVTAQSATREGDPGQYAVQFGAANGTGVSGQVSGQQVAAQASDGGGSGGPDGAATSDGTGEQKAA
jgi:hypothetical protein